MNIREQVEDLAKIAAEKQHGDRSFFELKRFYADMKQQGIAKPPEYTLPPLDTAGRGAFASFSRHCGNR